MKKVDVIVLAAGKSKRLKLAVPKVIVEVGGRPLIFYLLDTLVSLKKYIANIFLVVGYKHKLVEEVVSASYPQVKFIHQQILNGTAKAAELGLKRCKEDNVLVLCGDTPLIKSNTLKNLLRKHLEEDIDCSLVTAEVKEETDLGRILRDKNNRIVKIVETQDLSDYLKSGTKLEEVNSGIYCFKKAKLYQALRKVKKHRRKKEYFLTDVIEILAKTGAKFFTYSTDFEEVIGINTQKALNTVYRILNERFIQKAMDKGVRIIDPATTFLSYDTRIGKNCIIYPFTFIEKNVIIGNHCSIGPFAHIRENTVIEDRACIGNFTEICRSRIGKGVKMKHFSYLGDAFLEEGVNIGAGTVTANYDGKRKHKTFVGKNAFIGSDTIMVAPVKVGKKAITGAGSVVTKNVGEKTIVVGVPARFLKRRKD